MVSSSGRIRSHDCSDIRSYSGAGKLQHGKRAHLAQSISESWLTYSYNHGPLQILLQYARASLVLVLLPVQSRQPQERASRERTRSTCLGRPELACSTVGQGDRERCACSDFSSPSESCHQGILMYVLADRQFCSFFSRPLGESCEARRKRREPLADDWLMQQRPSCVQYRHTS